MLKKVVTDFYFYDILKVKQRLNYKKQRRTKMKKTLSKLLVCVLLLGCIFSLAGCVTSVGPITVVTGKYKVDILLAEVTYDFGAFGGVTVIVDPIAGDSYSFDGKYKVDNSTDPHEITFTFEDSEAKEYSGTFSFSSGKEDGVKYVEIAGVKYKQDK